MNDPRSSLPSDPDALAAHLIRSGHLGDGLPEIAAGCVFLLYSAMCWSTHLAQHHSPRGKLAVLILILVTTLTGLAAAPAIPWLRARFLTARSGYVRRKPRSWRLSAMLASAVLIVAIFTLVILGMKGVLAQRSLLMITGILMGSLWMFFGRRRRYVVNGVLMMLSGVVFALSTLQIEIAWTAFYASVGILTFSSGVLVLRRLIRRTSEQPE